MANWTDGAAYAPIERPDGFAQPEAEPLPVAEVLAPVTAGAIPPPTDYAPMVPQAPLTALGAAPPPRRPPQEPFQVYSALLTSGSTGYGPRDPMQPYQVTQSHTVAAAMPPPPQPHELLSTHAPYPSAPVPLPREHRAFYLISGVGFILGALLPLAAPVLFLLGGALLLRTDAVGRQIGVGALVVGGVTGMLLLAGVENLVVDVNRWLGLLFGVAVVLMGLARKPS